MKQFPESINVLINITVLALAIFLASFLWMELSPLPPSFIYSIFTSASFFVVILFVSNIGFSVLRSKHRIAHIIMTLVIIVIFVFGMPLCGRLIGNRQRQWFFQSGRQQHELMIHIIMQNESMLASTNRLLNDIVGRSSGYPIYGRTNVDESMTVWFWGRSNNRRWGYLYYSGTQMIHAYPVVSPVTSKPASRGRFKTGHSEALYSYQLS